MAFGRVASRILDPFPTASNVAQGIGLVVALIGGGTFLGVAISGLAGLLLVVSALLALAVRAVWELQRELDHQPRLLLRVEPRLVRANALAPGLRHRRDAAYYRIVASAVGGIAAEDCQGMIVACEEKRDGAFVPHPDFVGAISLRWPSALMDRPATIEPDAAALVVVAIAAEDENALYLGSNTGIGHIQLGPGEYRVLVRIRAWNALNKQAQLWLRVRHHGAWDEVELMPEN